MEFIVYIMLAGVALCFWAIGIYIILAIKEDFFTLG